MCKYYFFEKHGQNHYSMLESPEFDTERELNQWTFYEILAVEVDLPKTITVQEYENYIKNDEDNCILREGGFFNYVDTPNRKKFYQDIICSVVRESFTKEDLEYLTTSFAEYSPF